MSDKKDLLKNPLDDYTPGPSLLDKASSVLVEQIKNYQESQTRVIEELEETIDVATDRPGTGPSVTPSTYKPSPFSVSCPDFDVSPVKQALLERQWNHCRDRWEHIHASMYPGSESGIQEVVFSVAAFLIQRMAIEHFVAVQPMDDEHGVIFNLSATFEDPDMTKLEEGTPMRIEILKNAVEAVPKKLRASWTMELAQDLNAAFGDDFKREIAKVFSQDIATEIYKEFLSIMYNTEHRVELDGSIDQHTALHLYREANDIARRSYRGTGNKLIASNSVVASLIRAEAIEIEDDIDKRYGHVNYVGKCGTIEVFVDADMILGESVLAYKGGHGETDAGLFYCPYQLLTAGGMTVDPRTFQPSVSLYTHHGVFDNNLSRYVSRVTMTNMSYSVEDDKILTELFDKRPLRSALTSAASLKSPKMPLGREVR